MADRYMRKLDGIEGAVWALFFLGMLAAFCIGFFSFQIWIEAEKATAESKRAADYAEAICKQVGGTYCDTELVSNRRLPSGKR